MRQLHDFHGGIHPPDNKARSTARPIRVADLPGLLVVPLQQHIGTPATCLVAPGDRVDKGQRIAAAQELRSVSVHAPTSGRVLDIRAHPVPHPSGMEDWCVLIEPDGEERWTALEPCGDFQSLTPQDLLQRVREAGIAGLGGAGFPTHEKLDVPEDARIQTLILNGAECEPYITADQMLMQERERAAEIVGGLEIMARILAPDTCLIAVEDNKPEAIAALTKAAAGTGAEIVAIPTRYPSGGEKQLIEILTGQQVPGNGIPADIGVICQNVATAAAVYRAVRHGEPLISRITTITGAAVAEPGNFEVLIGTPLKSLLDQAGLDPENVQRLVMGGPLMGFALDNLEVPVTKTANCIIAATAAEFPSPPPAQACIRCGLCEQACPMELLPQQLYWFARAGEYEKAAQSHLFDCIECGACSYVCPSSIPLVQYYRNAKGEIRHQQAEQAQADRARARFEARQQRLEREQVEKEARRKARAAAAARASHTSPGAAAAASASAAGAPSEARREAKAAAVQAALARAQARKAERMAQGRTDQDVDERE